VATCLGVGIGVIKDDPGRALGRRVGVGRRDIKTGDAGRAIKRTQRIPGTEERVRVRFRRIKIRRSHPARRRHRARTKEKKRHTRPQSEPPSRPYSVGALKRGDDGVLHEVLTFTSCIPAYMRCSIHYAGFLVLRQRRTGNPANVQHHRAGCSDAFAAGFLDFAAWAGRLAIRARTETAQAVPGEHALSVKTRRC
jgi:hypothetical protein